jgi:hypothetical protein
VKALDAQALDAVTRTVIRHGVERGGPVLLRGNCTDDVRVAREVARRIGDGSRYALRAPHHTASVRAVREEAAMAAAAGGVLLVADVEEWSLRALDALRHARLEHPALVVIATAQAEPSFGPLATDDAERWAAQVARAWARLDPQRTGTVVVAASWARTGVCPSCGARAISAGRCVQCGWASLASAP